MKLLIIYILFCVYTDSVFATTEDAEKYWMDIDGKYSCGVFGSKRNVLMCSDDRLKNIKNNATYIGVIKKYRKLADCNPLKTRADESLQAISEVVSFLATSALAVAKLPTQLKALRPDEDTLCKGIPASLRRKNPNDPSSNEVNTSVMKCFSEFIGGYADGGRELTGAIEKFYESIPTNRAEVSDVAIATGSAVIDAFAYIGEGIYLGKLGSDIIFTGEDLLEARDRLVKGILDQIEDYRCYNDATQVEIACKFIGEKTPAAAAAFLATVTGVKAVSVGKDAVAKVNGLAILGRAPELPKVLESKGEESVTAAVEPVDSNIAPESTGTDVAATAPVAPVEQGAGVKIPRELTAQSSDQASLQVNYSRASNESLKELDKLAQEKYLDSDYESIFSNKGKLKPEHKSKYQNGYNSVREEYKAKLNKLIKDDKKGTITNLFKNEVSARRDNLIKNLDQLIKEFESTTSSSVRDAKLLEIANLEGELKGLDDFATEAILHSRDIARVARTASATAPITAAPRLPPVPEINPERVDGPPALIMSRISPNTILLNKKPQLRERFRFSRYAPENVAGREFRLFSPKPEYGVVSKEQFKDYSAQKNTAVEKQRAELARILDSASPEADFNRYMREVYKPQIQNAQAEVRMVQKELRQLEAIKQPTEAELKRLNEIRSFVLSQDAIVDGLTEDLNSLLNP